MDWPFGLLALALWVVFFAVDAIWRGYVHARSTGMTATVAGAVLAATGRLGPIRYLDFTALRVAGTALAIIGIGLVAVGHGCVMAAHRRLHRTDRTRAQRTVLGHPQPIFTFMTPNVVAMAGVVALWFGIELHVRRVEETY